MKPRSYFATVEAMPGFLLNGGVRRVRSVRFRMRRDADAWLDAMMAQPFAGTGKLTPSRKAPECNALS